MRTFLATVATLATAALAAAQASPSLLRDVLPGPASSFPHQFAVNGATAMFRATDPSGRSLWRTDGTAAGTAHVAIEPGWHLRPLGDAFVIASSSEVQRVDPAGSVRTLLRTAGQVDLATAVEVGDRVFFVADDGALGPELWSTDGTVAGTRPLDLTPGPFGSEPAIVGRLGGWCAAIVRRSPGVYEFVTTDGTSAGTRPWPGLLSTTRGGAIAVGTGAFFVLADDTIHAGRIGGTTLRIAVPAGSGARELLGAIGNRLVYADIDPATGREPWVTDGTAAGTRLLADLIPGPSSGSILFPIVSADRVAFFGPQGFWVTDGTPAGTRLALPTTNVTSTGSSAWLERSDGRLLAVTAPSGVRALWEIDVVAASAASLGTDFFAEAAVGGRLVARYVDAAHGNEPWTWGIGALAVRSGAPCGAADDAAELFASAPRLGGTLALRGSTPRGATLGLLVIGGVPRTAVPVGNGCSSQVDPAGLDVLATLPPGPAWAWSLPLPPVPQLVGITLAVQAWFGPSTLPLGAEASNGVHLTFG